MKLYRYIAALLLIGGALPALAQEKLPDGAKVTKLDVRPTTIELSGPFAYSQLLVTATLDSGEAVDVTRIAKVSPPKVAAVNAGLVRPTTDGTGEVEVSLAGLAAKVPVTVKGFGADKPVSFVTDVQPVLSKLGCNAGTCHGAQAGKNGFKLSLRGYDPLYDFRALTDDLEGRRFNRAAPEKSLMLMKPAGAVPHQGGVTMTAGDPNYELVRKWISQGLKLDLDAVRVTSLEIFPKNPIVGRIGQKQQFAAVATYADGRRRDVTAETFIESSNTEVATVDKTGVVATLRRGETTMLARYEGAYAASTIVIMGDRSGFEWKQQPVYNYVDDLVDVKLKKVKVQASDLADDAAFLRRVYLDLTGLPPTGEQVRQFTADARDGRVKREAVVDSLVGSDAFVEHWSNKWADMLMVNRKFLGDVGATAFRKWIRDAVAENRPYDKFAYQILTATGSNVENPPGAYYKTLRTPDAVMENTTQLFLAVRFNCNKCHDHPFEKWTQDQYFSLAAYFAQVGRAPDPKYRGQTLGGTAVEGAKPLVEVISDLKAGEIKHDRTSENAKAGFPYSVSVQQPAEASRREQVAKWITASQNQYFAKSYVNRVWSYLLGVGIIEPVDDIRAGNPPTNPELLDKLTADFVASGFDTQKLIKTICKSRTYQLSLATNRWNKDDEINYSHALARRLPAEVLFDTIHRATGSQSRLPGLPAGARAAQLLDSNVELPGGFLDIFNKPVRETSCECERGTGLNIGPIMAMVNGPVVGDAIKDPNNRLNKLVLAEKDDAKVADEIYLAVLNRLPSAAERKAAIAAIRAAAVDHAAQLAEYKPKLDAFNTYKATLDAKQAAWEESLKAQKPTAWTPLEVRRAQAQMPDTKLMVNKDGSVLVGGKVPDTDLYTIHGLTEIDKPITALRLEVLADPTLPAKGPGRAENGNFVLNEFRLTYKAFDKPDAPATAIKLKALAAIFSQETFPAANAVDGNPGTGWATAPRLGVDNAALYKFDKPVSDPAGGYFTAILDQRYGGKHTIGKFRLSVTTDANPKLQSSVSPAQLALLETPLDKRTPAQKDALRQMYLAQDKEYARLAADTADAPPADARVLGAQDLVWALINNPAFLFNH
ncbi:Vegetatible incompatibility protein OS=uncultured planctomycete GN=HGMM_F33C03C19 PE=4 SV=1: Big_2: PSCyt2: PSD1 [Gemmata massiliana]|uniref:BIG2 domain-containing protein n=1 Tax=Gemmata massiliana TaxID=1210884 RepID=A0A6P2D305_9BACT|nr:DUF1549 domain-containing protein [Gemmata massiliana]VTR95688.1 Vegetatible incompatibility protein OS=uncultured planctomycete GN=HGMM_F33C03C19 PE=4 SV=1: Big_2: PSCyt2: PSD1 [Gemmata massiliana]